MRITSAFVVITLWISGCAQLPPATNPLAALENTQSNQLVIAETSAILSQIASVDVYLDGAYVGNTGDTAVLLVDKTAGEHVIAAEGRFAAAYAERTELRLQSTDGHQFILIEPTLRGPITIRAVSRVQWEALTK